MDNKELSLTTFKYDEETELIVKIGDWSYYKVTDIARRFDKRINDYTSSLRTKTLIQSIAKYRGISEKSVFFSKKGGDVQLSGTWFHEDLMLDFSRWLSLEFSLFMNSVFVKVVNQKRNELEPSSLMFGGLVPKGESELSYCLVYVSDRLKETEQKNEVLIELIHKMNKEVSSLNEQLKKASDGNLAWNNFVKSSNFLPISHLEKMFAPTMFEHFRDYLVKTRQVKVDMLPTKRNLDAGNSSYHVRFCEGKVICEASFSSEFIGKVITSFYSQMA